MKIEYGDVIRINTKIINSIISNAVEYIEHRFYGNKEDTEGDNDSIFLEMNKSTLLEKLNISEELFERIIFKELEFSLLEKKIEMNSNYDKLYFIFEDKMKVYKIKGCIISNGTNGYTFYPKSLFDRSIFKDYENCEVIIKQINERIEE